MALSTSRTLVTKTGISTAQVFDMGGINISGGDFNLGSNIKLGNASGIITATTFSGASLDISGNADIDGTLEADAYTVDGTALNEYIADTVGAMVNSNTESGITVAYQDADNTLDFTVGTLNQNTTGTAGGLTGTPNISCGTIAGSTGTFTGDVDIADKIVHTGDTNTAIRFPAADTITAETGGSERLRIDSGGDVSINSSGLSSPYSASFRHLSINNNLILNAQNSAGGFAGMQNNAYLNSSGNWVRVNNDHATSIGTDDGTFYFRNAAAGTGNITWNQVLRITSDGDMGLGLTSPTARLHVSDSSFHLARFTRSSGAAGVTIEGNHATEAVYLSLKTLNNTANSGAVIEGVDAGGNGTSWIKLYTENDSTNAGAISLHTRPGGGSTTERLRIKSDGSILIGNTNGGSEVINMVGGGGGILISRSASGSPNDGQTLADIGLNSYSSSQTCSSADVLIRGQADGAHSGSSAGSALLVFTKPASTGPGSAPTERLRINKDGNLLIPASGKVSVGPTSPAARFTVGPANGSRCVEIEEYGVIRGYDRNSSAWAEIAFEAATYSFDCAGTERVRIENLGDSEYGLKFKNSKAIEFKDQNMGIFSLTWSISANTWTNFFSHQSYFQGWLFLNGTHNAGNSSALWSISKSPSGGDSATRFAHHNSYSPASIDMRVNGLWTQIKSSYATYGYATLITHGGGDNVANLSG